MQQTRFRMGIGLTPPPPTPQNQTVKKQSKAQCNLQGEEKIDSVGCTGGRPGGNWVYERQQQQNLAQADLKRVRVMVAEHT